MKQLALDLAMASPEPGHKAAFPFNSTMFFDAEYGWVSLAGEEQKRYSQLIDHLCDDMDGALSRAAIANLVQGALLKAIDIRKADRGLSHDERASRAVDEVARALASPVVKWVSCTPILGIEPPSEPWPLGDLTLIDINGDEGQQLLRQADRITDSTTNTAAERTTTGTR